MSRCQKLNVWVTVERKFSTNLTLKSTTLPRHWCPISLHETLENGNYILNVPFIWEAKLQSLCFVSTIKTVIQTQHFMLLVDSFICKTVALFRIWRNQIISLNTFCYFLYTTGYISYDKPVPIYPFVYVFIVNLSYYMFSNEDHLPSNILSIDLFATVYRPVSHLPDKNKMERSFPSLPTAAITTTTVTRKTLTSITNVIQFEMNTIDLFLFFYTSSHHR